jgi:hypothetical protein
MEAAFKPEVNGELDTRNFMKFDEVSQFLIFLDQTLNIPNHHCYVFSLQIIKFSLDPLLLI